MSRVPTLPDLAVEVADIKQRLRALEAENPTQNFAIPKFEWAWVVSNTVDEVDTGLFQVVFNEGIVQSNGSGWALGNDDKRIEVGDAGNYLVFANAAFQNFDSPTKTVNLISNPYYYNGSSWVSDVGLYGVPFDSSNGYTFPQISVDLDYVGNITHQSFYAFGVPTAIDGGIELLYRENDTDNPVVWSGVAVTLIRMPQTE